MALQVVYHKQLYFPVGAQGWEVNCLGAIGFKWLKYDHSMLGHDHLEPEKAHSGLKSCSGGGGGSSSSRLSSSINGIYGDCNEYNMPQQARG